MTLFGTAASLLAGEVADYWLIYPVVRNGRADRI